jgi:hypothetical protein
MVSSPQPKRRRNAALRDAGAMVGAFRNFQSGVMESTLEIGL